MPERVLTHTILSPGHVIPAGGLWFGVWATASEVSVRPNRTAATKRIM
jgi:hypothetical protein